MVNKTATVYLYVYYIIFPTETNFIPVAIPFYTFATTFRPFFRAESEAKLHQHAYVTLSIFAANQAMCRGKLFTDYVSKYMKV